MSCSCGLARLVALALVNVVQCACSQCTRVEQHLVDWSVTPSCHVARMPLSVVAAAFVSLPFASGLVACA